MIEFKPQPLRFTEIRLRLVKHGAFVYPHKGKPNERMLKKMLDTIKEYCKTNDWGFMGCYVQGRFTREYGKMSCWLRACTSFPHTDIIASLKYLQKQESLRGRDAP